MTRHVLAIDLIDDANAIQLYEWYHRPEQASDVVTRSIAASGVIEMEIFRVSNRLVMIMDVSDNFNFEKKAALDAVNQEVVRWETEMGALQQPILGPGTPKWSQMKRIYSLQEVLAYSGRN